jgi:acyl-CoA thioesterase I
MLHHLKYWFFFFACISGLTACQSGDKPTQTEVQVSPKDAEKSIEVKSTGKKVILFFGNSLTAGYGLDEPDTEAFPAIIQKKIDSLKLDYQIVNAGNSGETTSGGKDRINWVLKQKIEIFVLELGGNDGLRGIKPQESQKNLLQIIQTVKEKYPQTKIILTGMEAPPNMGQEYTTEFSAIFKAIAQATQVDLVPFILAGVGGEARLNQPDGIHPTSEGHKILAQNVWAILQKKL